MKSSTETDEEHSLLLELRRKQRTGEPTITELATDDRVLARISDGIYRQPASALRELISNAYDADATSVIISTDAPRFETISVKDDGLGMDERALVHLIHHIGGSAKRMPIGADLGITDPKNFARTPSGRKLIGKIGIGLFSVAQLGRKFQIITKKEGAKFRLVADVQLKTYSEDRELQEDPESRIRTGTVTIRSVRAEDAKSHGTEIILLKLHPAARDMLQSRDIWERLDSSDLSLQETFSKPDYHIGRLAPAPAKDHFKEKASLPWKVDASPEQKFMKLYESIGSALSHTGPKPSLENTFDRYLQTIWSLSLAAPIDYMDGPHPFDLTGDAKIRFFMLANDSGKPPEEIKISKKKTLRETLAAQGIVLKAPQRLASFSVFVDGIKLARPIRFKYPWGFKPDEQKTWPIMFVGHCRPPVEELGSEVSGGRELEFESYFMWSPLVLPREHVGTMIRIADNSGTLFDKTFLGYKVSEVIRLSQITSELFVLEGLDAALNIDRESFNYGHTHAKIVTSWVHRALRQVTNTQKKVASELNKEKNAETHDSKRKNIQGVARDALKQLGEDSPREVLLTSDQEETKEKRRSGVLVINPEETLPSPLVRGKGAKERRVLHEDKLKALAQILDGYGLLDNLSYSKQQRLFKTIFRLFQEDI